MITDEQIADGCNKAYLKAGHNAYFGNGFEAGVRFALEQVKNCSIPDVVGQSEQLCQHDRSVTNRICDDCGSVITYVPDDELA